MMQIPRLFIKKMEAEGRKKEWWAKLRDVQKRTGLRYTQAVWQAMVELGYRKGGQDSQALRRWWAEHEKKIHQDSRERELREMQAEIKEDQRINDWEEAISMLPPTAPVFKELDWIRSHPAMARLGKKNKIVQIDVNDVLYRSCGRAPSRSAVFALQHWANHPTEFYKQMLSEDKKRTKDSEENKSAESESDYAEIRDMLRETMQNAGFQGEGDGRRDGEPEDRGEDSLSDLEWPDETSDFAGKG